MTKTTLRPVFIEATTLPDSWFQVIWNLVDFGKEFTVDRGSYAGQKRPELDYVTVHIRYPGVRPLLPDIPAHLGIPNHILPELVNGELLVSMVLGLPTGRAVVRRRPHQRL